MANKQMQLQVIFEEGSNEPKVKAKHHEGGPFQPLELEEPADDGRCQPGKCPITINGKPYCIRCW